jgi:hypothetical protein
VLNISGFLSSLEQCIACQEGTFCSVGSAEPTPCAPGTYNPLVEQLTCLDCSAGTFQSLAGNTTCVPCTPGYFCGKRVRVPPTHQP